MSARAASSGSRSGTRRRMLAQGEWRPTATAVDPLTVGFHVSGLYSPVGWLSWERIARDWSAAQGSDEAKRSFKNTVLGETWFESGEAPDWQRLYERREESGAAARCRRAGCS